RREGWKRRTDIKTIKRKYTMNDKVYPVIIIGAGPAGLTAGIYTARANLNPLIIEGPKPGGQLMGTSMVENWPGEKSILGPTLMINMLAHAKQTGCDFLGHTVASVDFSQKPFRITTNKQRELLADSVIIATGAQPNTLECPGEKEYWGKGVTTCAVCDGAFYPDKHIVIIGGGDTAMEDASFMTKFTNKITVIQNKAALSASTAMQKRVLENPAIKIIYDSSISEFKGNGSHLTHVVVKNLKTEALEELPADGAFLAIGMRPTTMPFTGQIELDKWGYVKVYDQTKTSIPGIFVAGDVADFRYRQAITSAGVGCMAALDVERYLKNS
ncbi:thioredoxin-disulfide reductase, partial [Methylicorpusculum sp.]|uniref:thioredoxin-disulfide reductase n=1 Tax=Methylicorpusculum sp. TaxID=2713644 RepID=UPI002ABB17A9